MNIQEMVGIIINEILIPSLKELYRVDYNNILFGVSERNICARLAHHIEHHMRQCDTVEGNNRFQEYFADVEYNRMGNGDLKHYENNTRWPKYMVSDLLIHKRGYGRNLLALEMKRKGNKRNVAEDQERLKSLVSSPSNYDEETKCVHDTLLGVFMIYSHQGLTIELFENIDGQGEKTGEMSFTYDNDREELRLNN